MSAAILLKSLPPRSVISKHLREKLKMDVKSCHFETGFVENDFGSQKDAFQPLVNVTCMQDGMSLVSVIVTNVFLHSGLS